MTPGTVDADIYRAGLLSWCIAVFQHRFAGGNEEILGEITRNSTTFAESFDLTPAEREQRLRQLADNGLRRIREDQELESKQSRVVWPECPE